MPLADWDFFQSVGANQGLNLVGPIVGTSSLTATGTSFIEWHAQRNNTFSRGFDKGKVRTLMRTNSIGFSVSSFLPGIFCLSDVEDITPGGTSFYCVIAKPQNVANNVKLKKINDGIGDIDSTTSLIEGTKDFSVGTTIALELEWIADLVTLGGTLLTVRVGDALDYSDLAPLMSIVDTTSPYTTGFAEGLVLQTDNSGVYDMFFDETDIFSGV